jgi:hypothetical protein
MSQLPTDGPQGAALCQSFLLRLWREDPGGERRVLLQDILEGKRHCFADLDELFAFLNSPEGGVTGEAAQNPFSKPTRSSRMKGDR